MIRYLTAGESHGEALIGVVEGLPAGVPLTADDLNEHLGRRWLGYGRGGRSKIERDQVHVYSGVRFSKTLGSPVGLRLDNGAYEKDRAGWPEKMALEGERGDVERVTLPRPGHADLAGARKYGFDRPPRGPDLRPVIDRSSARETAMRVACCSTARQLLRALGIEVGSHVVRIGRVGFEDAEAWQERAGELLSEEGGARALYEKADESATRMIDPELTERCVEHIDETKEQRDSLGGAYEVVVTGVPAGLGSYAQWDRRLDGKLAQAILSIQAQKGVEVGDGVAGAGRYGSEVHDEIIHQNGADGGTPEDAQTLRRRTNRAGGVEGGVSNGMPLVVRGFMKPIPTLIEPLDSVDLDSGEARTTRYERSDVTSVPAASTVAEATVALVVANALLERFGGDRFEQIQRRFEEARSSS
ncbi:MAG: chorismate synthase [Bacteroidetes bacterium SW_4_67_19]|jgi:chorismate synthase|nr:MAG: chorismate synthase [Bacteroidetes bacterium SW_4_67_19]